MIKYTYPERTNKEFSISSQRNNTPIIHTNVSTYAQVLISFHEFNPVPLQHSHKKDLKCNSTPKPSLRKETLTQTPQLIQHHTDKKTSLSTTLKNNQQRLKDFGTPTQFQSSNPQLTSKERSANTNNQSTKFIEDDEPITLILNNPITPPLTPNSTFQYQSIDGRGRGAYATRGRGGRGIGPIQSQ